MLGDTRGIPHEPGVDRFLMEPDMVRHRLAAFTLTFAFIPACDSTEPVRAKPAPGSVSAAQPPVGRPGAFSATLPVPTVRPHRVEPLSRDCPRPAVALTTIPGRSSRKPYFPWVEAAFRAHPEFVLVSGPPAKPMEVRIESYPKRQKDDSDEPRFHALVARCADADTCNKAANMFAAVVPSSQPKTVCGATIPGTYGPGMRFDLAPVMSDDPLQQCARWVVCKRKFDRTYDSGPSCEKAEKKQLACSKRETCERVVACAGPNAP
jgi:hypothetical protein